MVEIKDRTGTSWCGGNKNCNILPSYQQLYNTTVLIISLWYRISPFNLCVINVWNNHHIYIQFFWIIWQGVSGGWTMEIKTIIYCDRENCSTNWVSNHTTWLLYVRFWLLPHSGFINCTYTCHTVVLLYCKEICSNRQHFNTFWVTDIYHI